jgi:hypothetical protein
MHYAVLLLFCAPILFSSVTAAQPSTAPSSSLPVTPLSPATTGVGCDLCRSLEGRKGSDRDLHPHKNTPGVSHSQKRSLKSQLPHRKLGENEEEPQ